MLSWSQPRSQTAHTANNRPAASAKDAAPLSSIFRDGSVVQGSTSDLWYPDIRESAAQCLRGHLAEDGPIIDRESTLVQET